MVWVIFRCTPIPVDAARTLQKWFVLLICMMYIRHPSAKTVSFIRGYTNVTTTCTNYSNSIGHGKRG